METAAKWWALCCNSLSTGKTSFCQQTANLCLINKNERKTFNNHDAPLRFLTSPWDLPRSRHGQRQCAMEVTQVEVVLSGRAAQCIQHSNSWKQDIWPNSLIHSVEVVSDFQPNNVLAAGYNFPVKYKIHNIAYEEPLGFLNVTFVLKNIKSTFWIH